MEPPTTPATPPPPCHPNEPSVQGNRPSGGPTHRCGWETSGKHHHSGPGGTTLHLVRLTKNQMRALQKVGTHYVPFLQHPEWPKKSVLEITMRSAATQTRYPQPTDGEVREVYGALKGALANGPTTREPGPPLATRASGVCTRYPGASSTSRGSQRTQSHIVAWHRTRQLVDAATTHSAPLCLPPLSQDKLTGTPTTCWRCGPQGSATPRPILQLLARYDPIPTDHATPEQQRWLNTHLERAAERDTATVACSPSAAAEWRFHRGTGDTKHPAITFPVLAKHHSATPEAPAYPVKHGCSRVQDWQTIERITLHPQKAYLLQYVYGYLTQGHKGNNDFVRINPAATEIIRQGVGGMLPRDSNRPPPSRGPESAALGR